MPMAGLRSLAEERVCPALPGWDAAHWDTVAGAGAYGTFAALLSGFALSGLLWIATDTEGSQRRSASVVGIWAAIVPLAISALLYGEIAGELDCEVAVHLIPLPSILLTVGAVATMLYLGNLLRPIFDDSAEWFSRLFRWTILYLGSVGVIVGNSSLLKSTTGPKDETGQIIAVQALVVLVAAIVSLRSEREPGVAHAGPIAILGISLVGYSATYLVSTSAVESWMAPTEAWGRVVIWVVFVWFLTRPSSRDGGRDSSGSEGALPNEPQ